MCTAEPGWPARSGSSPGAAGRWCLGWCQCEGQPVCWWESRSMTDSAASSGPGPTGPNNDCSESESEQCWTKSWRMIWPKKKKRRWNRTELINFHLFLPLSQIIMYSVPTVLNKGNQQLLFFCHKNKVQTQHWQLKQLLIYSSSSHRAT